MRWCLTLFLLVPGPVPQPPLPVEVEWRAIDEVPANVSLFVEEATVPPRAEPHSPVMMFEGRWMAYRLPVPVGAKTGWYLGDSRILRSELTKPDDDPCNP